MVECFRFLQPLPMKGDRPSAGVVGKQVGSLWLHFPWLQWIDNFPVTIKSINLDVKNLVFFLSTIIVCKCKQLNLYRVGTTEEKVFYITQ